MGPTALIAGLALLAPIKNDKLADAWGDVSYTCHYQLPADEQKNSSSRMFISGTDKSGDDELWALVNISGIDTKLKLVKRMDSKSKKKKVGDRDVRIYQAKDVKLEVIFVVTSVCKPKTGCEGDGRDAILKVSKVKVKEELRTVGYCAI